MVIKIVVIVMLLLILASLGSGLFFLIKDRDRNPRTVKALTVRIALSAALFLFVGGAVLIADAGLCDRPDHAARSVRRMVSLHPVDEDKQAQPNHVHKVPIPRRCFKGKMPLRREMASHAAQQNHRQDNSADSNVQTVKAGQHKEGRTVNPATQGQVQLFIRLVVLGSLTD